jgi:alpha,alpha-trehalase
VLQTTYVDPHFSDSVGRRLAPMPASTSPRAATVRKRLQDTPGVPPDRTLLRHTARRSAIRLPDKANGDGAMNEDADAAPDPIATARSTTVDLSRIQACICDLDGVLTDTAATHLRAWKHMFDAFLRDRLGDEFQPFTKDDYRQYVDGKPRYDGAQSFLESRDIELPHGDPDDPPDRDTVCGLGNRKNRYFHELLEKEGVDRIEPSIAWVRAAKRRGLALAVVTSSRNGRRVLDAAGIQDLFQARVDGMDGQELDLPGKPDPAYFLEAARRLDVDPGSAAIVEDAEAGVEAGRRGGFGLVIGIADEGADRLRQAGADVVVKDLSELPLPGDDESWRRIGDVPFLLDHEDVLQDLVAAGRPALFLDYDGTLTPIVSDPDAARLPEATRHALERARDLFPVSIISGRDLDALREFVRVDGIYYAGSHGLHIRQPDGTDHERAVDWLPALDRAEQQLRSRLQDVEGAAIERKRFAIAVHYRNAPDDQVERIQNIAIEVADGEDRLRRSGGKKIVELRPDLDWDKGSALRWILDLIADGGPVRAIYIGDDVTDEDAFRALPPSGLPVVVRGEDDDRRTAARYALTDPEQVRRVIERLADLADRKGTP